MSPSDLQQPVLLSVLGAGFVTAFLHAALPTHWLPFVLVGRGQRWALPQVLTAVATAGLAHIFSTAVVGALIFAEPLDPWVLAGGAVIFAGLWINIRAQMRSPA